jgi:hypothetical protein
VLNDPVVEPEAVEFAEPMPPARVRAGVEAWHVFAALLVVETALFAWFGVVNRDEGWYLYAGRLVFEGKIPYRDFSYFQAPVLPYLYGLPQMLFGPSLLAGRVTSVVFVFIAAAAIAASADLLGGRSARTWALALLCANPILLCLCTLARSEAATVAACTLAVYCLVRYRDGLAALLAAPALLLLAAGIRSPLAIAFLLATGYAWWRARASGRDRAIAACVLLAELLVIAVPVLLSTDRAVFELWSSQVHRSLQFSAPGATSPTIQARIETIYSFTWVEFVVLLAPLVVIAAYAAVRYGQGWRPRWRQPEGDPLTTYTLLTALALVTFVPFVSAEPFEPRYFVPASALLTVVVAAAAAAARPAERDLATWFGPLIAGVTLAVAVCAAPLYIVLGQTQTVPRSPNAQLRGADRIIAADMGPGDRLLAFDPTLAVAADVKLMPGLEMGQFSYWPTMLDTDARAHGVYNKQALLNAIGGGTPKVIALTDFDLGSFIGHTVTPTPDNVRAQLGQFPVVLIPSLVLHYKVQDVLDDYGQYGDHLYILVRK